MNNITEKYEYLNLIHSTGITFDKNDPLHWRLFIHHKDFLPFSSGPAVHSVVPPNLYYTVSCIVVLVAATKTQHSTLHLPAELWLSDRK